MLAKDIKEGGFYVAKVGDNLTVVRVDAITHREGSGSYYSGRYARATTRYSVTNMVTGRGTVFRSASKFRRALADRATVDTTIHELKKRKDRADAIREGTF